MLIDACRLAVLLYGNHGLLVDVSVIWRDVHLFPAAVGLSHGGPDLGMLLHVNVLLHHVFVGNLTVVDHFRRLLIDHDFPVAAL